jgi:hypothetical protein
MTLQDLLSIKNEHQFRDTCSNYLAHIGSGCSRDVYRLNSKQVIKVAKHDLGYTQNASECDIFNTYGGLGLFNEITRSSDSYLWVIQPLAIPLEKDDARFGQLVNLIHHLETSREYVTDDSFLKTLYKFLIETEWKFLCDFKKCDSWGVISGELRIIDYGMNNEAYNEYFK